MVMKAVIEVNGLTLNACLLHRDQNVLYYSIRLGSGTHFLVIMKLLATFMLRKGQSWEQLYCRLSCLALS